MKNTEFAPSFKNRRDAQMSDGKYSRGALPNGSSVKTSVAGRNNNRGEHVKVSRNVHANINFSELNEVCLDVGKVDLSHTARFRNDSNLSPFKCSRDNSAGSDLGKRPSKLSGVCVPRRKNKDDEAWRGWDSKISFVKQHGCPVVSVKEHSKTSHTLVMSEDLVKQVCLALETNSFSYYCENFEKNILGVNTIRENEPNSESNADLKSKIREYFAKKEELESFLESMDCSLSLSKKRNLSRQLDFDGGNASTKPVIREDQQKCKREKAVKRSCSPMPERCVGFSPTCIHKTNKRARKFLDFYTKFKNSSVSMRNLVN